MVNKLYVAFLTMLASLLFACGSRSIADPEVQWINFYWYDGGPGLEKGAVMLPFTLDAVPHRFTGQFDSGATTTAIYENSFAPFMERYDRVEWRLDSTHTSYFNGVPCHRFKRTFDFLMDSVSVKGDNVLFYSGYGDPVPADSIDTPLPKHICTIALDLFDSRILIIDYPNTRIGLAETIPGVWEERVDYMPMEYDGLRHSIYLPVTIDGVERKVWFDTGSSPLGLVSSSGNVAKVASQQSADSLTGPSWGQNMTLKNYIPEVKISLGGHDLSHSTVTSCPLETSFFDALGIWGIMGNRYFYDKAVVIDFPNRKFGIIDGGL